MIKKLLPLLALLGLLPCAAGAVDNFGMFMRGETIAIDFATYDSNLASVTISDLAQADVEVYKRGSITQCDDDTPFALIDTDGIDIDGITGFHGITIDTSSDSCTDTDFWEPGGHYIVRIGPFTANGQTVQYVATFSLDPAVMAYCLAAGTNSDPSDVDLSACDWLDDTDLSNTLISVVGGTGDYQNRTVSSASSLVASVNEDFDTDPSSDSEIVVYASNQLAISRDPTTNNPVMSVGDISGDSTAADNAESFFDDTGFDASNSTIGGIDGTIQTLDALDTAQDTQHTTTQGLIGTPSNLGSGADLASNMVDIEAETDDIGTAGIGLTAIPWNAAWDAEAQSEAADALAAASLTTSDIANAVWGYECEPDNTTAIQCDDAMAYILAYAVGNGSAPADGLSWDVNTTDGLTDRIDVAYGSDDGDRTVTLTAPTR